MQHAFATQPDRLHNNAERYLSQLAPNVDHDNDRLSFSLVHCCPPAALPVILQSGQLTSLKDTNTYSFDRMLGLGTGVFFTPGFATIDAAHPDGHGVVLSRAKSQTVIQAKGSLFAAHDFADILKVFRITARDVREQSDKFQQAVDVYMSHLFPPAQASQIIWAYVQAVHHGHMSAYLDFVFTAHQGRAFDHLHKSVEDFYARHALFPLVPEIIVPSPVDLGQDVTTVTPEGDKRDRFDAVLAIGGLI
ncbi:hypothetical protein V5T82_16860 [Magnetovibrio sp. PR-2]|uniref:hypothetical protein n=1 Tax=Magnetovibrio sp. PR-2 TaxID=3120356 RepID=UPI002FCE54AE